MIEVADAGGGGDGGGGAGGVIDAAGGTRLGADCALLGGGLPVVDASGVTLLACSVPRDTTSTADITTAASHESYSSSQPYEESFTIHRAQAVKGSVLVETSVWGRHLYGHSQNVVWQMLEKI